MTKTKTEPRGDDAAIKGLAAEAAEHQEKPRLLPKPKRRKRWVKWAVFGGVALALILIWKLLPKPDPSMMTQNLKTAAVETDDLTVTLNGTGTVAPAASYSITALVSGEVLAAPFEEGQVVLKDALLYRIDSSDVQSGIDRAELAYQRAKDAYQRLLDNAKDYKITAPIAGTVTKLSIDPGDMAGQGAVAVLCDRSVATVKLPFFAEDAAVIKPGMTARVTLAESLEPVTGTVTVVSAMEEVGAGGAITRQVTIEIPNPRGVKEGSYATASVNGLSCNAGAAVRFPEEKSVTAKAAGEVAAVYVREGDTVEKGAVLAVIDDKSLRDQITDAKRALDDAALSLSSARDQLENYEIRAPIAGTVIEKNLKTGDTLDSSRSAGAASSAIALIYDLSHLEFTLAIDELDVGKVEVGQSVRVTADSVEGKTFTGHVSKVSVNGTTQNGATSYPVTVILDTSDGLFPGMNVSADIFITERKGVLCVPAEAVERGNTVLVTKDSPSAKNGTPAEQEGFVRVPVTPGLSDESRVEITAGLQAGDTVAYFETTFTKEKMSELAGMSMNNSARQNGMGGARPNGMN